MLQAENKHEFPNNILSSLKAKWTEFKIVFGKPRHNKSQSSVKRANQYVENMLTTWI